MPQTECSEVLNVGVVGVGVQGEGHVKCYAAAPRARVVAVCDADADRAQQVARKYGVGAVCAAYQ
jgi:predicted dehydrogenase